MRLFDCILYNGEIETLEIRLNELDPVVDVFVIVEATRTFSGLDKPLHLRSEWARVRPFARKIRYVVIDDDVAASPPGGAVDPWDREAFQRNGVVRGLLDATPDDLVMISDVDEIPRAACLREIRARAAADPRESFGLVLTLSYFALNYVHVAGPEVDLIRPIVVPHALLERDTPETLRTEIRDGHRPARRVAGAGWHFSYLSDRAGIVAKIRAFSHQEYNTPAFLAAIDLDAIIAERRDLFGRDAYAWAIAEESDLPASVRERRAAFAHRILTAAGTFAAPPPPPAAAPAARPEPIILCPYVREADRDRVVAAFGLDTERGRHLPFHLWRDEDLQGPERAFAKGWARFPERDVIILHTDMAPLPEDVGNDWYARLRAAVEAEPGAGLIGCDLLYPLKAPSGAWYVQCAGGFCEPDGFWHIGGHVDLASGTAGPEAVVYDAALAQRVRPVDWVTFGGVYLRRELIDMIGDFDPEYRWAYVMDTDFSLEAALRGSRACQVPVALLHEENGSTRAFLDKPGYREAVAFNEAYFRRKWGAFLARRAARAAGGTPGLTALGWGERRAALLLAEAEARGQAFAVAAYARGLGARDPEAVTLPDVEQAYRLILDRPIDAAARAAWQGEVLRRAVRAEELAELLCGSEEYAALRRRAQQRVRQAR